MMIFINKPKMMEKEEFRHYNGVHKIQNSDSQFRGLGRGVAELRRKSRYGTGI